MRISSHRLALALAIVASWFHDQAHAGANSCPGVWRSLVIPGTTDGIADVAALPDGTLAVALKTAGLRLYERAPNGSYSWRSITAGRGGLASNKLNCLAIFQDDLWIGTQDAGISVRSQADGTFRTIDTTNSPIPSDYIASLTPVPADPSIARPKATDETLWASTPEGAALYHFVQVVPLSGWAWRALDSSDGLPNNFVRDTAVQFTGGDRYTWFALKESLVRWDGTSFVDFSQSTDGETAERILADPAGHMWFAPLKVVAGIGPGDGGGGTVGYVPVGLARLTPGVLRPAWDDYPDQFGHDMCLDAAGRLWTSGVEQFGADSAGAWVHDQGTWCVFKQPDKPITSNQVSSVQAMGELTWFAQDASPTLDAYTSNWSRLTQAQLKVPGELGPTAVGLTYFAGGLQGLSLKLKPPVSLWTYVKLSSKPSSVVTCLLPADDGVWVGLEIDGLRLVHLRTSDLSVSSIDQYSAADGLAGDNVQALAMDKGGRFWVGTSQGLSLRGNGYWLNFTAENSPLLDSAVRSLAVDDAGKLWIATYGAGISILDPEAKGGPAWSQATTAEGLPSNDVRALAAAPGGVMWAATGAGACRRDPSTGLWAVYTAENGALPSSLAFSVAIDSSGRAWVGTAAGLAVREAGEWRHFHVTSSSLENDTVTHVSAILNQVWATNNGQIAVRDEIVGPIGEFPPVVSSFSPAAAAPGDQVTVTGQHFDARGPGFNQAFVGDFDVKGNNAAPAEIVSVTATKLVFRVPDLADDGLVRVVSNCLEDRSPGALKIAPKITFFTPDCAALGDEITIHGAGFTTGGGAQVRFGGGPWRSPALAPGGDLRADVIRIRLQPGDQSGALQVRGSNGAVATATFPISVGHVELNYSLFQQGVEGLRLVWGKRTLFTVGLKAVGCGTKVGGGRLYWKKKDGSRQLGGKAYSRWWDQDVTFEVTQPISLSSEDFEALEFIGEFESARSGYGQFFPLSELESAQAVVMNGGVEVLTVEFPASQLHFREVKKKLELIAMGVFAEDGPTPWQEFWSNATASLIQAARIMPQPDFRPFYGSQAWMDIRSTYITRDSADLDGELPTDDFARITSLVDGLIEPGFGQFGMGLIDPVLYTKDEGELNPSGKAWVSPGDYDKTAVSFNFEGTAAPIIAQELSHMLGLVDGDAQNHDDDNVGHSRYDECNEQEDENGEKYCVPVDYKTYSQAVGDQIGNEVPRLWLLTEGLPERLDIGLMSSRRAKSSMSYAPGKKNWNSFLEPVDHQAVLAFLTDLYEEWTDGDGGGAGVAARALNLRFLIGMDDAVEVTTSYLDESGDPLTAPHPEGHHRAVVLDAGGSTLVELPFVLGFHTHGGEAGTTRLAMRIPFPEGAKTIELRHEDEVLWSVSMSANAPAAAFTAPGGGTIQADQTVQVAWTASDPDGDALRFALDYSADGGATWIKLPQDLTGTSFDWRPGFLPRSDAARLRIRASDGFNTVSAVSAPFRLTAGQPLVFVRSPVNGSTIPEGSLVDLVAMSITSEGIGLGTFAWQVDGRALGGTEDGTEFRFETAGDHVVHVALADPSGLGAEAQVTVHVLPDFDRDGLPNDWEQAHGLNPLDPTDASKDPDQDGLSNFGEHYHTTDPQLADTDGDGASDSAEIAAGTDPLDPASKPRTQPELHVGPDSIGFTVVEGDVSAEPKTTWVQNLGPGALAWSLENDLPWLDVSPAGGSTPAEVTFTAFPAGLGVGTYTGQVVFSSQGVAGSPHVLTVRLTVKPRAPGGTQRFIRGDSNADGRMNISDASFTLTYLFIDASRAPACLDAADANDDGEVNITDAIFSLGGLFLGGPLPPAPYPDCGIDATPDAVECGHVAACE